MVEGAKAVKDSCVSGSRGRLLSGNVAQLNFSSDFYFQLRLAGEKRGKKKQKQKKKHPAGNLSR